MTNIIQKAIAKAMELHEGRVRKDEITPYIVHPLAVGYIMSRFTSDQEIITAAILHDVVEDTGHPLESVKEEFGENVAYWVDLLSEDKSIEDWAVRKDKAIKKVSQNTTALVIKAADCLANMKDLHTSLQQEGSKAWDRFNAPKDQKMLYFKIILDHAKPHLPADLLHDYVATIKDLEYSDQIAATQPIGFSAN